VLWQKERLLNLALRLLPARCEMVAWLDCDIVFASADWAARACAALEAVPLVHLFHARHEAPRDWAPDPPTRGWPPRQPVGRVPDEARRGMPRRHLRAGQPAVARFVGRPRLASRRDTLDAHGFYDAFIVGGGDRAMLCAALGESHRLAASVRMNAQRTAHYRAWAQACFERVRGRVGCIPGHVLHLWHGDLADRKQRERHHHLAQFDFDPVADLAVAPSGAWRWNSAKPPCTRLCDATSNRGTKTAGEAACERSLRCRSRECPPPRRVQGPHRVHRMWPQRTRGRRSATERKTTVSRRPAQGLSWVGLQATRTGWRWGGALIGVRLGVITCWSHSTTSLDTRPVPVVARCLSIAGWHHAVVAVKSHTGTLHSVCLPGELHRKANPSSRRAGHALVVVRRVFGDRTVWCATPPTEPDSVSRIHAPRSCASRPSKRGTSMSEANRIRAPGFPTATLGGGGAGNS